MALSAYVSEKTIDLLTKYGYSFCVMLLNPDSYLGTSTLYALKQEHEPESLTAREATHHMKEEFLNKARENLKAAQICFENGLYNACANRSYYAALQAAVAALADKGITRAAIDHKWVQADFSEMLVNRRKIYPAKLKSYLREMQILRNNADYKAADVSKKKVRIWLSCAQEMVACIEKELKL